MGVQPRQFRVTLFLDFVAAQKDDQPGDVPLVTPTGEDTAGAGIKTKAFYKKRPTPRKKRPAEMTN